MGDTEAFDVCGQKQKYKNGQKGKNIKIKIKNDSQEF